MAGRPLAKLGHNQAPTLPPGYTSCPGSQIQAWINAGMPFVTELEDDAMFCKFGDKNQKVAAMQFQLLQLDPNCLPAYGPDGGYGEETRAALVNLDVSQGDGKVYDGQQFARLQQLCAAKNGGGAQGPKGDPGAPGAPGAPGKTPTAVTFGPITATVTAVS